MSVLADDLMRMGDLVHSATVDDLGGIQLYRFTADPCTSVEFFLVFFL